MTTLSRYRPNGGRVFMFLLMAVFAPDMERARAIAQPGECDGLSYGFLAIDSAEAQMRLGVFADPAACAAMERGD